ncbi:MAG: hypothetical protein LBT20_06410 [Clostridiales bacterium]|jgi:hypothetical protein|nr:hypothetical protein [Clostridiales bacterium]
MDKLESILLELEDEVNKGKKFFGLSLMNKERLLSLIDALRGEFPEVIRESEEIIQNKAYILQEAVDLSLKRTHQAQETADYLVSTAEITMRAESEARLILEEADKRAFEIETDSKKRIDNLLAATEKVFVDHLNLVRNNRESLKGELIKQYVPANIQVTRDDNRGESVE